LADSNEELKKENERMEEAIALLKKEKEEEVTELRDTAKNDKEMLNQ